MSEIFELPPSGGGDPVKELQDLRNYLFRMVRQLNSANNASSGEIVSSGKNGVVLRPGSGTSSSDGADSKSIEVVRKQANALKQLIQKTSDEIYSYIDEVTLSLEEVYVARSEFGEYTETVNTTIQQTAKATVESYQYDSKLTQLQNGINTIGVTITSIQGEIRRGFVNVDGEPYFGIAIADKLNFSGTITEKEGMSYYEISDYQSFGLYTAQGWMFFLNGVRVGWFSSLDGMLHVANIAVEDTLQMGDWLLSTTSGFGIRYIGE